MPANLEVTKKSLMSQIRTWESFLKHRRGQVMADLEAASDRIRQLEADVARGRAAGINSYV
jgi:hypothetical protein